METVRDIFIILFTGVGFLVGLVALVGSLFIFRKVNRLIGSAGNVMKNVEKVTDKVSSGASKGSGVGTVLGFLGGLNRHRKNGDRD